MHEEQGRRAGHPRQVVARSSAHWRGIAVSTAIENIRRPTEWTFAQDRHVLVIHAAGQMASMETVFENGPRSQILPEPGGIWLIPAGWRYAALALGDLARFIEIQIPARMPDYRNADLRPVIAGSDPFLWQVGERLASLIDARDDVGHMLAENLSEAVRNHLLREYALGDTVREQIGLPASFSIREQGHLRSYIDDNLGDALSLERMADLMQRSVHNFLIAFRAAFETTPIQYVIERRLARVRMMLLGGQGTITEIALATGFASHSHLTSTFRKHMGASPTQWRRRHRE
ncbi:AraC family transcriptional regulator [Sphingobium aquiterrae]|uniref:AraC family transcriptional regulator n=1 Tax=Sphingobium aquiterrae TaxID=2038656 RepID=UPI0030159C16